MEGDWFLMTGESGTVTDSSETETATVDGSATVDGLAMVMVMATEGGGETEVDSSAAVDSTATEGDSEMVGEAAESGIGIITVEVLVPRVGGLTTENSVETADSSSDSRAGLAGRVVIGGGW